MFSGNRASLGPAVTNTASVVVVDTEFRNNSLLCDDIDGSMFLDWQPVSFGRPAISMTSEVGLLFGILLYSGAGWLWKVEVEPCNSQRDGLRSTYDLVITTF